MRLPESMQAWRIHEHGGPEKLQLDTVPVPRPAAGELLVRVAEGGGAKAPPHNLLDFIQP